MGSRAFVSTRPCDIVRCRCRKPWTGFGDRAGLLYALLDDSERQFRRVHVGPAAGASPRVPARRRRPTRVTGRSISTPSQRSNPRPLRIPKRSLRSCPRGSWSRSRCALGRIRTCAHGSGEPRLCAAVEVHVVQLDVRDERSVQAARSVTWASPLGRPTIQTLTRRRTTGCAQARSRPRPDSPTPSMS
jgi:hypothetical protein